MRPSDVDIPETLRWAAHSFNVDQVTAEVTTAFDTASIDSILLKGPAIATWLYSGDQPRLYTDTDLLVQKRDWDRAKDVMLELGFQDDLGPLEHPRMESGEGHPWCRPDGAEVDLHYALFGIGASPERLWKTFSSGAARERIGGAEVSMPSRPARLLHISLHAVQHGGERQLKPMRDLERALDKASNATWVEAHRLAESLEADRSFAAGLRLLPKGRDLADAIGATQGHSTDTALRLAQVPLAEGFQELADSPGLRNKAALVVREVFPKRAFMRWWSPLARRGRLSLALAYLGRPFWLVLHAPRGLRAWRSSRRGTHQR